MSDHVYRLSEIVGSSSTGQIRGQVVDGDVAHVQVAIKIGFRVED